MTFLFYLFFFRKKETKNSRKQSTRMGIFSLLASSHYYFTYGKKIKVSLRHAAKSENCLFFDTYLDD
jgi:hypothetical protein